MSWTSTVPQNVTKPKPSTWNQYIASNKLPGVGCYSAKNLSSSWQKIPCVTAKPRPLSPKIVGNGYEPVLNASSGNLISNSTGTFVNVTGIKTETDSLAGPNGTRFRTTRTLSTPPQSILAASKRTDGSSSYTVAMTLLSMATRLQLRETYS